MIVKHYSEVTEESVDIKGVKGVSVRWLIDDTTGLNFAMRRYRVKEAIPIHSHSHEHGVYILSGSGKVLTFGDSIELKVGDFVFIQPDEPHGFENAGQEPLVFLCMVPKERGNTKLMKE